MRRTLLQAAHMVDFHTLLRFPSQSVHVPNSQCKQSLEIKSPRTAEFWLKLLVAHNTITPEWLHRCFIWLLKSTALPTGFSLKIPVSQGGDSVSGHLWLNLWLEKCLGSFLLLDPHISFLAWTVCGQKETFQWLKSRTHGQNYRVTNLPFFCPYLKYRCGRFRKIQPELFILKRGKGRKHTASSLQWEQICWLAERMFWKWKQAVVCEKREVSAHFLCSRSSAHYQNPKWGTRDYC